MHVHAESVGMLNVYARKGAQERNRKKEYRNDISLKSSNVKLNINDVCNLIER